MNGWSIGRHSHTTTRDFLPLLLPFGPLGPFLDRPLPPLAYPGVKVGVGEGEGLGVGRGPFRRELVLLVLEKESVSS